MKKGFTLIELLGVIIIISVLVSLTFVSINNALDESAEKLYDVQINEIEKSTSSWVTLYSSCLSDGAYNTITLGRLKYGNDYSDGIDCPNDIGGLIDINITNPITEELFLDSLEILITYEANQYTATVMD
ncbi:MAG: prepilin-type N-terminal cleavage/methylation domain-containing protein [Mycoplasmatota bacterium]